MNTLSSIVRMSMDAFIKHSLKVANHLTYILYCNNIYYHSPQGDDFRFSDKSAKLSVILKPISCKWHYSHSVFC